MNSMNRTITSLPINRSATILTECSLKPALTTVFTLTFNPASLAASIPFRTVSGFAIVSLIVWNVSISTASSETVTLSSPASTNAFTFSSSSKPFVVMAISNSLGSIAMKSKRSFRNNGSPPVRRIFSNPSGTSASTMNANSS